MSLVVGASLLVWSPSALSLSPSILSHTTLSGHNQDIVIITWGEYNSHKRQGLNVPVVCRRSKEGTGRSQDMTKAERF